ncbi:MAG: phage holin family protein [Polyangiaceae bacterium]|jgi:hypothetical protein
MAQAIDRDSPRAASSQAEPTGRLLREALEEAGDLVRLEVALAREEVRAEVALTKRAALAFGAAVGTGMAALTLCLVAMALTFQRSWLVALIVGAILFVAATACGLVGWVCLPKRPLGETKDRLEAGVRQIEERVA